MDIQPILKDLAILGVTTLTQESIKLYVNTRIKPIFANWGHAETRYIALEECISEYLLRCYTKNIVIPTIVFGKLQKTLDDLYIPLTLEEYRNKAKKWIIDETCYNILEVYDKVLIIDKAGMGKSTIIKYFACQGVNLNKCIPIVIELRKLDTNQSILEYIKTQLASYDKHIEIEEIVRMLSKGDFVIFFDGYDEISNDNKSNILDQIQEFVSNAKNTKVVITSREEDDLNSLGEFKCVNIKPLEKKEAYDLIRKYDNNGTVSKKLIKRLEEDTSLEVLHEFLTNPLLVSLLYKTFDYKEEIPYKKIDFYDLVYAALFNDHDKTKGSAYVHEKKTKLDKFEFEKVLRTFSFLSLKFNKVEYSSQIICDLLEQSIERFGWLKIRVSDFLDDITVAVPFVQQEGNEYKWVHKSFMEYFASCFICYDNKEFEQKYLEKMMNNIDNKKFYNVLDFCYDIDTLCFRKYAVLPYCKHYINKYDKSFTHEIFDDYSETYLDRVKYLLAINDYLLFYSYKRKINDELLSVRKVHSMFRVYNEGLESCAFGAYSNKYYILNKIIREKMPELFTKINFNDIVHKKTVDDLMMTEFYIDDDDNNIVNSRKDIFYQVVDSFFLILFHENAILNYDKCKELIEEIEAESNNNNSSLFEL